MLDLTDANTIAEAPATVGELDVLVNNAGISLDTGAPVTETHVEVFRRTYETKVFGVSPSPPRSCPRLSLAGRWPVSRP